MKKKVAAMLMTGIALQGATNLFGCSSQSADDMGTAETVKTGTLGMALQTTSASGKVYRLRQATFRIDSQFSGSPNTVTLNSENDPSKPVLETFLAPSSYVVQLVDGWFIEQVDQLLGTSAFVDAQPLSSSFQFFDIQSNQETFVRYDFEVSGERISFGDPGRLIVGIGINERQSSCGDGIAGGNEACDGGDLRGNTCASVTLGFSPFGSLFCDPFCNFDTSGCFGQGAGGQGTGGFGAGGFGAGGFDTGGTGGVLDGGFGFGGAFESSGGAGPGGDASTGGSPGDPGFGSGGAVPVPPVTGGKPGNGPK